MKHSRVAILVTLFCVFGCFQGGAQILNLAGDYAGKAGFGSVGGLYVEYATQGIDTVVPSGLTTAYFATGGIVGWKDSKPSYYWGGQNIGCSFVSLDGSSLRGICSGEGWTEDGISGTFRIDRGTGRFEGYGGVGSWTSRQIRRIPGHFPGYDVLIHVEGSAAPVPEPSTLTLLLLSGSLGAIKHYRRLRYLT